MPNLLELDAKVEKFLENLTDKKLYQRFFRAIEQLKQTSVPHGAIKLIGSHDTYRLRVGDYRILYRIQATRIIIALIDHRKDVYR